MAKKLVWRLAFERLEMMATGGRAGADRTAEGTSKNPQANA